MIIATSTPASGPFWWGGGGAHPPPPPPPPPPIVNLEPIAR